MKYINADEEQLPRATKCAAGSDGRSLSISTHTAIYYLPTKLQVNNVFTGVCLSVNLSIGRVGSHLTIIFDALDLTIQSPPPRHWISLYTPLGLTPPGNVQTRSTWILLYRNPQTYSNLFIMTCTVCKQTGRILLECFLVYT